MPKSKPNTRPNYRDATTGKYVSEDYAKQHPNTTVKETDKIQPSTKPKKKSK